MHVPLAIFGAGPVGQSAALLIARSVGLRIALIDRYDADRARQDPRAVALSQGSLQLLSRIVDVDALPRADIREVRVTQRGRFGSTTMRARDHGVDALGAVVRYADLMRALEAATARFADAGAIVWHRPVEVTRLDANDVGVTWQDSRGETHDADFAAQAEGGRFDETRARASERSTRAYAQTAIVCEVECARPQSGAAFERFGIEGPLALLPLPEPSRYSVVWCVKDEHAQTLANHDGAEFARALHDAFGPELGAFALAAPRHAFKLGRARRRDLVGTRLVRIGNAAQILHPVAGQGLNLGLRDAHDFARAMREVRHGQIAEHEALVRFDAARRGDRASTMRTTDAFARGFAHGVAPIHHAAGLVLEALDLIAPARGVLARRMMFGRR